jgi:hypothetical protein
MGYKIKALASGFRAGPYFLKKKLFFKAKDEG